MNLKSKSLYHVFNKHFKEIKEKVEETYSTLRLASVKHTILFLEGFSVKINDIVHSDRIGGVELVVEHIDWTPIRKSFWNQYNPTSPIDHLIKEKSVSKYSGIPVEKYSGIPVEKFYKTLHKLPSKIIMRHIDQLIEVLGAFMTHGTAKARQLSDWEREQVKFLTPNNCVLISQFCCDYCDEKISKLPQHPHPKFIKFLKRKCDKFFKNWNVMYIGELCDWLKLNGLGARLIMSQRDFYVCRGSEKKYYEMINIFKGGTKGHGIRDSVFGRPIFDPELMFKTVGTSYVYNFLSYYIRYGNPVVYNPERLPYKYFLMYVRNTEAPDTVPKEYIKPLINTINNTLSSREKALILRGVSNLVEFIDCLPTDLWFDAFKKDIIKLEASAATTAFIKKLNHPLLKPILSYSDEQIKLLTHQISCSVLIDSTIGELSDEMIGGEIVTDSSDEWSDIDFDEI